MTTANREFKKLMNKKPSHNNLSIFWRQPSNSRTATMNTELFSLLSLNRNFRTSFIFCEIGTVHISHDISDFYGIMSQLRVLSKILLEFNPFKSDIPYILKPVDWLRLKFNWLVSKWKKTGFECVKKEPFPEADNRRCYIKNKLLKIPQNSQKKKLCQSLFFNQVAGLWILRKFQEHLFLKTAKSGSIFLSSKTTHMVASMDFNFDYSCEQTRLLWHHLAVWWCMTHEDG